MVQLKYWGDEYDYFKYDLITSILKGLRFKEYVFLPMLTVNREDSKEGKKLPRGNKSLELFSFIQKHRDNKNLKHWETWLGEFANYHTVEPVNTTYFKDSEREYYWSKFNDLLSLKSALIFVDPDTGLQTGSHPKNKGEKYLLNDELCNLISKLDKTSTLMIYQHLQPDKNLHLQGLYKKLNQIRTCYRVVYICGYRENDLAFIFVSKTSAKHRKIFSLLEKYHSASTNSYKSEPIELLP